MKEQIKSYLNRYVHFNEEEIHTFCDFLSEKKFDKKEFLLKEGQVCHHYFFISSGLIRQFYIDEKGNEKIIQFAIENWWTTNIDSFTNQVPSALNIQALEKTTAYIISKKSLENLFISLPKTERLFRIITEKTLIAHQRRNYFFMKKKSKERYQHLMEHIPEFAQRVPQYMLASYLEITPEYLSEIRKKE